MANAHWSIMIPDPTLGGVTTLKLPVCVCARPYNYVVCSSTNADREKEREDTHTKLTEFSFAQDAFSNKFILPKSQGIAIALGHQLNNSTRPESILKEADRQRERGGGRGGGGGEDSSFWKMYMYMYKTKQLPYAFYVCSIYTCGESQSSQTHTFLSHSETHFTQTESTLWTYKLIHIQAHVNACVYLHINVYIYIHTHNNVVPNWHLWSLHLRGWWLRIGWRRHPLRLGVHRSWGSYVSPLRITSRRWWVTSRGPLRLRGRRLTPRWNSLYTNTQEWLGDKQTYIHTHRRRLH